MTLVGVVLLLVLAASRGWLTPPARLGAGVLLGPALAGLGLWLHRREAIRTGALALGRVPWITGDGIRDPDGCSQGGGRQSYRAVLEPSDNAASGHLGANTAFADPRDTA